MNTFKMLSIRMLCTILVISSVTLAQDKKAGKVKKDLPSEEEMMKNWQEAATAGEAHKMLAVMEGSWEIQTKMWMNGPGTEPTITKGSAEMKMVMDGKFLQQEVIGEMMGMPMTGIGLTGYDNFKKKYVSFWVDNTGTAMYHSEGTLDKDGKTITYWGKMDEPMTGEKDKKVKYVDTTVDENSRLFRIYDVTSFGENTPVMEMTYTRKK